MLPLHTAYDHIANSLCALTWYIMSSYQEKLTMHTERKNKKTPQFEGIEQASEPDIEMFELSD